MEKTYSGWEIHGKREREREPMLTNLPEKNTMGENRCGPAYI